MASEPAEVCIGVLALQGAFREHLACLRKLPHVHAVEVRTKEQLAGVDGLIIPGGALAALQILFGTAFWWLLTTSRLRVQARAPPWRWWRNAGASYQSCAALLPAGAQSGAPVLASSFWPTGQQVPPHCALCPAEFSTEL